MGGHEIGREQKNKSVRGCADHTILSAKLGSDFPPPPIPLRALNMPGQRKQTKATMPSWMRGEAYQLVENLPILLDLYIHPGGRGVGSGSAEYAGGVFRSFLLNASIMNGGWKPSKNRGLKCVENNKRCVEGEGEMRKEA